MPKKVNKDPIQFNDEDNSVDNSVTRYRGQRGKEKERELEFPIEEILNAIPKKALAQLRTKYYGSDKRGIKPDKPRSEKQLANDERLRKLAQEKRDKRYQKLETVEKEIEQKIIEEKKAGNISNMIKVPKSLLTKTSGTNSHVEKKIKKIEEKVEQNIAEIPKAIEKVKKAVEAITPPASPLQKKPSTYPSTSSSGSLSLKELVSRRMGRI